MQCRIRAAKAASRGLCFERLKIGGWLELVDILLEVLGDKLNLDLL